MPDPDWLTVAAEQLTRVNTGRWAAKKKATIIAITDARLAKKQESTVWNRAQHPDVCSKNTYYKWLDPRRVGYDPVFVEVLAAVSKLAQDWRDEESLRALQQAARRLALASPVAVAIAVELLKSPDAAIQLRAAFGILDRAGIETAAKSSSEVSGASVIRLMWGEAEMDSVDGAAENGAQGGAG